MRWRHPELGEVAPIKRAHQPAKVWKHLYDPAERWGQLSAADPQRLHDEAVEAGCPVFRVSSFRPRFHWRVRRLLERHHDLAYGPAYASELGDPRTRWGPKCSDATRWVGRSPNSVVGIVAASPVVRVLTAYRPLPPIPGVGWSDEDFRRQADYVFEKETGLDPTSAQRLAEELQRVHLREAATMQDCWWLALAVARGRGADSVAPEVQVALEKAERSLASTPDALRAELVRSVRLGVLVDRLSDGLKQTEPEDVECVLSDLEDALLVLDALGAVDEVATLVEQAGSLIHWTPPEFMVLAAQARHRLRMLPGGGAAAQLWAAVEESVTGAALRDAAPMLRPKARLVDLLVPDMSVLERVAAIGATGIGAGRSWLGQQLDGLVLRGPVPIMGRDASTEPWLVRGEGTLESSLRMFAVDAEYPDGYDITALASVPGAALWQLERPGQAVTFVLVRSDMPLGSSTLSGILTEAEGRTDIYFATREISRPS